MPSSPTWEDTIEDEPSWDDTSDESGPSIGEIISQPSFQVPPPSTSGYGPASDPFSETPRSDFARELVREVPTMIGEGLHGALQPVEYAMAPVFSQFRQAAEVGNPFYPGTLAPELKPNESYFTNLEPPPEARGVIPSLRRAAAGMTTPGALTLLPVAGGETMAAKLLQGAFATGAAASVPPAIQAYLEAETPAEKRGAATDAALGTLFTGVMGRQATRPRTLPALEVPESVLRSASERPPTEIKLEPVRETPAAESSPKAAEALTPERRAAIEATGGMEALEWPAKDLARYRELIAEQRKMQDEGKILDPNQGEFTAEWTANMREFETLRNKYNGMPPKQVVAERAASDLLKQKGGQPQQAPPPVEAFKPAPQFAVDPASAGGARPPVEPPRTSTTTEFPTEGESVRMRKSAERATTSEQIPEPVQERIAEAPESFYTQQSMKRVEDLVTEMPDADLAAVPRDSNLYTAARLEQASRLFKRGENDAGYNVFVELEKEGTRLGQLVNQFKMLKGTRPEEVARVINKKLEKSGKDPLNPNQEKKAIETASKSKEADRKLDESTDAWKKDPTPENAAKAEKALLDANAAGLELQRFVSKFQPRSTPSILKSVLQGNLLTPISQTANIVGNAMFLPFRQSARTVATGLDALMNHLKGSKRELTVQPIRGSVEALKGFGRGAKQIPDIFLRGTGDVIKGETRAGLHPIKAWINQFAKQPEMPTTGGKLTLQDRLNLAIEGTFGVPAEAMLRGLGAGDVSFREAAQARATATELSLAKVPKEQWNFAQKFPEMFLDEAAMQRIQADTLQAVFQRQSKTLNVITNWIRGKGDWFDLAVATVAPYKLTPWNIVGEILSYNPLVAFTRILNDFRKGDSRTGKLNAGKFVVGSAMTAAGWWLYKNGLMSPSLDQRDEEQKARVLAGEVLPPNHINLSGLERALKGGDPTFKPGDETADVFRAGGLAGSMFYMTANIGRDFERSPEVPDSEIWSAILRQSTLEQARFGMNQSFLSGVEGLLAAVREGNTDNYIRQWGNTVASIPFPNTLTTMSRASREYKPDFREDTFKKQMENIVRNKLGVAKLDDYLPLKRGLWGEPMRETPEGRNAIMYHFFDVFKNRQVTSDPVPLELFRLWRKTADTRVIPSLPEKTLTVGGNSYGLNAAQQSRYAELVGKARRRITDAIVINPEFHKLQDEQKIDLLDKVYRAGLQQGKVEFWTEVGGSLNLKPERAGFTPARVD